jgi:hypothetical protein
MDWSREASHLHEDGPEMSPAALFKQRYAPRVCRGDVNSLFGPLVGIVDSHMESVNGAQGGVYVTSEYGSVEGCNPWGLSI